MFNYLGRWFQGKCRQKQRVTAKRRTYHARPQLEILEDRVVPAALGTVTLDVTSTTDSLTQAGTLRNAIQTANADFANGTATAVTINILTAGTYQTTLPGTAGETDNKAGEFAIFTDPATPVGSNLTIQNNSGGVVTIDANHQNRVFDINPNNLLANGGVLGAVTLTGLTIENGVAQPGDAGPGSGGGIRDTGPVDLTLNNDIVTSNVATADGGGISMENVASTKWALTLNATTVSDNHAGDAGGGVEEDGTGKVFINAGSVISGNTCVNQGAGVWLDAVNGGTANLTINGAYIAGNTAGMLGGGVGNAGNGNVTIANSTLQNNTSTGFGGGFADQNNLGTLTVQNSLFLSNNAGTNGGGIQEGNGTTITNSEFRNNAAGVNGMMAIGTTGKGAANAVMGSGGGLFINGGFLTLSNSTVANNTAEINGGGIELQTTGAATITNSTIASNTALFNTPSTPNTPSVFLNNGGGIDSTGTGPLALVDDTVSNNFANSGGGIFYVGAHLTMQNTIVAQNVASTVGPDIAFSGITTGVDQGGNLIGVSGPGSGNAGVFTAGTTQTGTVATPLDPLLADLEGNGGPQIGSTGHQITLETEALLPGSPAIGKGVANGVTTDERGFTRLTPPSVGAFEFNAPTPIVTAATPAAVTPAAAAGNVTLVVTNTVDSLTQAGTLRNAIQTANADLANGTATSVTISIQTAGTYQIKLLGTPGETDNAAGEFALFTSPNTPVGSSLTIQNDSGGNVTINGADHTRVFDINPTNLLANGGVLGAVTITGVTIENGLAQPGDAGPGSGGGIRDTGPVDLTLNNDIITSNFATADGGGISMENVASTKWALTLNATTVSGNHAGDAGGGVEEDGTGKVFINAGSVISDNTTINQGAGIWLDAVAGGTANLTITGAYIAGNTAGMTDGGVGNAGNGNVIISNSTLQDNTTTGFAGGFGDQNNLGTLTVTNSLFLGNKAGTNGGGLQEGNVTTIGNSEFKNNVAGLNGMAGIGTTGKGAINAVQGSGGGLFLNGGSLVLNTSTIANNTAEINGGGIELQTTGTAAITNSTIAGNSALFNTPSTAATPSVFLNNGGGIDDAATGAVVLTEDTITNNFANNGGGLFFAGTTGLTLQNTIVAQNIASAIGPDADFTGAVTGFDLGGNLIGIAGAGSGNTFVTTATTQTGTVANPLNPLVTGLTNNGGPLAGSIGHQLTVETEGLLPGSPAIGKGLVLVNFVPSDERGFPRLRPPSVGAFEFENTTLTVTVTPASPTLVVNNSETVTVTITNTGANALPVDNSTVNVTLTAGGTTLTQFTATLGALAPGQGQNFTVTVNGTAVGQQTVTGTVTSPDTNPRTATGSATVTVTPTPTPTPHTPVGTLTIFAFGFGPTGIDLFDVDTKGNVFAVNFFGGGTPLFINTMVQLPIVVFNGQVLAFLSSSAGQNFLIDIVAPFNPFVLGPVLAGLHI
jgi:fibronectin-binding autotransporter adhesin